MYADVTLDINVVPVPKKAIEGLDFVSLGLTVPLSKIPKANDLIPISEKRPDEALIEVEARALGVPWPVGFIEVDSVHQFADATKILIFTGFCVSSRDLLAKCIEFFVSYYGFYRRDTI